VVLFLCRGNYGVTAREFIQEKGLECGRLSRDHEPARLWTCVFQPASYLAAGHLPLRLAYILHNLSGRSWVALEADSAVQAVFFIQRRSRSIRQ
jgi:hypothetical protein